MGTNAEEQIRQKYEAEGYEVLMNGWPDFLMVKRSGGLIVEAIAVEVKFRGDKPTAAQVRIAEAFDAMHFPYRLERIAPRKRQFMTSYSDADQPQRKDAKSFSKALAERVRRKLLERY